MFQVLLLLLLFSSSSPLHRVFTIIYLKGTMSLGYSVRAILWLQYMVATCSVTSHDKHFEVLRHHHHHHHHRQSRL